MKRTRKRNRKQPRRMTPPLILRDENGEREIVSVDEELLTVRRYQSGRVTLFLSLGPGLSVKVGSRCQNKRRYASLHIRLAGEVPAPAPGLTAYREILRGQH